MALLDQLVQREASKKQSVADAFRDLVVKVADENIDAESALAVLESIGKTAADLQSEVSTFRSRRERCQQIEAAIASADELPGLREQIKAAEVEIEQVRLAVIAKCAPIHNRIAEINQAQMSAVDIERQILQGEDGTFQAAFQECKAAQSLPDFARQMIGRRTEQSARLRSNNDWQLVK